jgi:hypothetical protein
VAQLLDIASNMHRLHIRQPVNALLFAPVQEGSGIAKFKEAQRGLLPCLAISAVRRDSVAGVSVTSARQSSGYQKDALANHAGISTSIEYSI